MNHEETIDRFLEDRPRAEQVRVWRETLERRLQALRRDGPTQPGGTEQLRHLERQIAVLREEEAVTQFVEDSVRVTLAMGAVVDGLEDMLEDMEDPTS